MDIAEGAIGIFRHFVGSILTAAILILFFLQDRMTSALIIDSPLFWQALIVLGGTSTIASFLVSTFINLPGQAHYAGMAIFVRSILVGVFLTMVLILVYLNDVIVVGFFMLMDQTFWNILVATVLITIISRFFMHLILPPPE